MSLPRFVSRFGDGPRDPGNRSGRVRATLSRRKGRWWQWGAVLGSAAALIAGAPLAAQQTGRVEGTVRGGATGQQLQDVQVVVEGTGLGTLTDADGGYVIRDVPAGTRTISAILIGYGAEERQVDVPAGGTATADFTLYSQAVELEGLVVTGAATATSRRELGNSISLITSEEIEASGATNVDGILRGRAAGVTIQGNTGVAGAGSQILLRGPSSINGRNRPLIYVDGVRLNDRGAYETGSTFATGGQAATVLNSIDPEDIERVEVVKGAAAATLYGTEASAGVIQIFTKKGSEGTTRWTIAVEQGLSVPRHVGPGSDPTGLHLNDCTFGGPVRPEQTTPDPDCPPSGSWLKTAHSQDYDLSARGGGGEFTFYSSASLSLDEGIVNVPDRPEGTKVGFDDNEAQDINLRANFSFQPYDQLGISLNNSYTRRDIAWFPDGDNDGFPRGFTENVTKLDQGETPDDRDALVFQQDIDQDIDHFTTSANINWAPSSAFTHRLNVGLDWSNSRTIDFRPRGYWAFPAGARRWDEEQTRVLTVDYAGSWNADVTDDWTSSFSIGGQFNDREDKGLRLDCRGFVAPGERVASECQEAFFEGGGLGLQEDRRAFRSGGGFVQERIGFKNRFFLTGGVRADAFSQINPELELDFEFLVYPKVQATYVLSDHDFWPNWFETFRLRGAWGESGEPPPQDAQQSLWQVAGADEIPESGFIIQTIGNPDIVAERTSEFEGGFDASLIDGRVSLEATGFYRETTDGILFNPLLPSAGILEDIPVNPGTWNTKGIETSLDVVPVDLPDLRLSINGQYQWYDNEVESLGELGTGDPQCLTVSFSQRYCEGEAFPQFFGDNQATNPDELAAPVLTDSTESLGSSVPTQQLSVGISANLWERLNLSLFGTGQFGHKVLDERAQELADEGLWPQCVGVPTIDEAEEMGSVQHTAAEILRCDEAENEHWIFSGNYFRFQSASLGYQLPGRWLPSAVRSATVRFRVENVGLFTDFPTGADPDALIGGAVNELFRVGGAALPPPRTFALSLQARF